MDTIAHNREFLIDIIKKNKPTRKDTTNEQYVRVIIKILSLIDYKDKLSNLDFMKNKEKIDTAIDGLPFAVSTKRNYYTALLSLLLVNETDPLYNHYKKMEKSGNDAQFKLYENKINDPQKQEKLDNTSEEDVIKLLEILLVNGDTKDYILFSLIYNYGYRNEISNLQVIQLKPFNKLSNVDKKGNNYLVIGSKRVFVSRNHYKTEDTYGEIENTVDNKQLKKQLKLYIDVLDDDYLFREKDGKIMTPHQLTNRLRYVSKKYIGVEISSTLLYKISMKKFKVINEELSKKAKTRGHSANTQSQVYIQ